MIKRILTLVNLICLSGCAGATFEKGLNYEKSPDYSFEYHEGTHATTIRKNKNESSYVNIGFGTVACGYYGLIGPLVFPIIPFWQNRDCKDVVMNIWEYRVGIKKAHILYHDKVYEPSKVSKTGYYTFPLQTKSITDTAILVIEKRNGETFRIPFRYKHTFSFDLAPGR